MSDSNSTRSTVLVEGLHFGEGPRWHDGVLYVSDFYDHAVLRIDADGTATKLVDVPTQPSGLGWLPDGRMLVVSMTDLSVLRVEADGTVVTHADLSGFATFLANDMVVDTAGRSYVGNFGFDLHGFLHEHGEAALFENPESRFTVLCLVDTDGSVDVAAEAMNVPNGTVITPDGSTMIIAETLAMALTAFDIGPDGRLSNRRVWADLSAELITPDGICLDADGAVWVANAIAPQAVRVGEGGVILARVDTTQNCYAVALGGPDGRTLFACTAQDSDVAVASTNRYGKIEVATVSVPAA